MSMYNWTTEASEWRCTRSLPPNLLGHFQSSCSWACRASSPNMLLLPKFLPQGEVKILRLYIWQGLSPQDSSAWKWEGFLFFIYSSWGITFSLVQVWWLSNRALGIIGLPSLLISYYISQVTLSGYRLSRRGWWSRSPWVRWSKPTPALPGGLYSDRAESWPRVGHRERGRGCFFFLPVLQISTSLY